MSRFPARMNISRLLVREVAHKVLVRLFVLDIFLMTTTAVKSVAQDMTAKITILIYLDIAIPFPYSTISS